MTIKELRENRANIIEAARTLLDSVETEGRSMDEEENRTWTEQMKEADALKIRIDSHELLETEERALNESRGRFTESTTSTNSSNEDALRSWLLNDSGSRSLSVPLNSEALKSVADRGAYEARALSAGMATAGGNTVPQDFRNALEIALLSHDGMRSVATVIRTTTGAALPIPTSDDTANEGFLVAENALVAEQDITFGQRVLGAYKVSSGVVRVSHELLQDSGVNVAQIVGDMLGTRIGRTLSKYHTNGTGVNEFGGALTDATLGIAGASVGDVTYGELVQMVHSVDSAYRTGAVWIMNDSTLATLRLLTDTTGQPLFQQGLLVGAPDTLLGHRIVINSSMPDLGVSAKPILFGAASKFLIRDVRDVVIVRADERYFEYDQSAFVGFYRGDSALIDAGTGPLRYFQNAAV